MDDSDYSDYSRNRAPVDSHSVFDLYQAQSYLTAEEQEMRNEWYRQAEAQAVEMKAQDPNINAVGFVKIVMDELVAREKQMTELNKQWAMKTPRAYDSYKAKLLNSLKSQGDYIGYDEYNDFIKKSKERMGPFEKAIIEQPKPAQPFTGRARRQLRSRLDKIAMSVADTKEEREAEKLKYKGMAKWAYEYGNEQNPEIPINGFVKGNFIYERPDNEDLSSKLNRIAKKIVASREER